MEILGKLGTWIKSHGPEIAIVSGYVGLTGAGVWACFSTAKAIRRLDAVQAERDEKLTFKEKFKLMAPYYIAPATVAAGSVTGGVLGIRGEVVRTKNIVAAAKIVEENLISHEEATKAIVGEKKADAINREASKNGKHESLKEFVGKVLETGRGDTYFKDKYLLGDLIFTGDIEGIRSRCNDIGVRMIQGDDVMNAKEVVEELYGFEGPDALTNLIWDVHTSTGVPKIDINTAEMPDEEGRIIHFIEHKNKPRFDFRY